MSLAEALARTEPRKLGPTCSVAFILTRLDADDAATLAAALTDPCVPGSDLARALTAQGHRVTGNTIQRHRRRDCTCG